MYVALGSEPGGVHYAMQQNGADWVSTDLRSWTKAPVQTAFAGTNWRSTAGAPGGFVAMGFSEAEGGSPAWFSADGLHWAAISDDRPSVNDTVEAMAVVYAAGEFVMVGRLDNAAAAWTSRDGQHWTMHAPLPGGADVVLEGLVDTPHGYLSLGASGPPVEVAPGEFVAPVAPWTSRDGTTWQAGASSPALFGVYPTSLVPAPGGFVATGTVGTAVGLWTSRDGIDWVPVAGVDLRGADESTLVSDGHHVLLIASGQNGARVLVSAGVTRVSVIAWAAASVCGCCSSRSTLKSSARIGASGSVSRRMSRRSRPAHRLPRSGGTGRPASISSSVRGACGPQHGAESLKTNGSRGMARRTG